MRVQRWFGMLILLTILAAGIATPAQPVEAAWGNVQLEFYSTKKITRLQIEGHNQHGAWSKWGPYNQSSTYVAVWNWWWGHGSSRPTVFIKLRLENGVQMLCDQTLNLSQYWPNNWATIKIDEKGNTSSSGFGSGRCSSTGSF